MDELPILAVDVDGVISLFGFETPPSGGVSWQLIDGTPHCISLAAGERLRQLSADFELVWATGWQDRANDRLPEVIGVGPLPVIEFDLPQTNDPPRARDRGRAPAGDSGKSGNAGVGSLAGHWKLESIDHFAGERAIAWIDDSFDPSCFEWAESREAGGSPTLLAPTEPEIGIEEGHVAALQDWARGLNRRP